MDKGECRSRGATTAKDANGVSSDLWINYLGYSQ
jgi:hypothetical protein